jgi:hypothetical protein
MSDEVQARKRARTDDGCVHGSALTENDMAAASDVPQEMTASQVAGMMSEMLAAVRQGTLGMDKMLKMCLSESVVVSTLAQRKVIVRGREAVIEALVTGALVARQGGMMQQPEPVARVVAESEAGDGKQAAVSLAMDVYAGGKSPFGVLAAQGGGNSLVVFRARRCQIDRMWVGECGAGAKMLCSTRESLLNSSTWRDFSLVISLSIELTDSPPAGEATPPTQVTFVLNNYTTTVDATGLGIGSETVSDTWTEGLVGQTEEGLKAAEEQRERLELERSLAALDKVTALLQNDKKVGKAMPILLKMLKSEVRLATGQAVLKAAKAALGGGYERGALEDAQARGVLQEVTEVVLQHKDLLLQANQAETQDDLETIMQGWRLHHVVANLLRTDDTFQFAKAGKELLQVPSLSQSLSSFLHPSSPPPRPPILPALLPVMVARLHPHCAAAVRGC